MKAKKDSTTPMMKQYLDIKSRYKNAFLFFRMGDFYEMFFEDAEKASKILNITLTARGLHQGKEIPMCGVPYHALTNYLAKMVRANQTVAICEQVENPKEAKGVVKREVVRVITPGTLVDDALLDEKKSNYLLACTKVGGRIGISSVELSTGEFRVTETEHYDEFVQELLNLNPTEIIIAESLSDSLEIPVKFLEKIRLLPDWVFDYKDSLSRLKNHFSVHSLEGFGLTSYIPGVLAAAAVIYYVNENCSFALQQLTSIQTYLLGDYMGLDESTKYNLDLIEAKDSSKPTIFSVLDQTKSAMGGRMLRKWVHAPLINSSMINERLNAVSALRDNFEVLNNIRTILGSISDIERITGRICCKNATPRDLISLKQSLLRIPELAENISHLSDLFLKGMIAFFHEYSEVVELIERSLKDDVPPTLKDGGVIREGFSAELDELRDLSGNVKNKIAAIQVEEAEKTGIKNLKIKYNNVFGYYLEVSKAQAANVPDYFIRKQTLVNAERYITDELKQLETKILSAEHKSLKLEVSLFNDLRDQIASFAEEIKKTAHKTAMLDVLASFADVADRYSYVCPEVNESDRIEIKDGRHPVVEQIVALGDFIPNDIIMDNSDNQISLITGPNMAGKSTYLRQAGLLVLLAHIGCHIPAEKAVISVVDRIFTRVGAFDDLAGGRSTFMVEMNETANILNNASDKSLIILDEIGRGTSTFDGISIAWAVVEYLSQEQNVQAKTLFATHYHELTALEKTISGLKNLNVAVREWNDEIMFLHKIIPGAADKSYGLHVARLAGLPRTIIKRGKEILARLESGSFPEIIKGDDRLDNLQMELFSAPVREVLPADWQVLIEELSAVDPLAITPIEAINILHDLTSQAKKLTDNCRGDLEN